MRYTKIALLTFGLGLLLGLVVIILEIASLERAASGLMALGLAAIPVGITADWRLAVKAPRKPVRNRSKAPVRRRAATKPRRPRPQRNAAPPKR